ncbi:MAG: peptidoglycan DD-metalloendopeptidase family protein [Alphaproteobacteria bacterium]|nr:peptidoglycan DD-metalloendopeptidase family protein [Alphaproteobacteria bacterium]
MKRHSHIISVGLMILACLIAAREYYIGYQLQNSLEREVENMSLVENTQSAGVNKTSAFAITPSSSSITTANSLFANAQLSAEKQQMLQVGKGDTISSLLANIGISAKEIEHATKALHKTYDVRDLKIGQSILVKYHQNEEQNNISLLELEFKPNLEYQIILNKNENGGFKVIKHTAHLKKVIRKIEGHIKSSFYNALLKQKVPPKIVHAAIKALSYTMNFQHDIKRGDPYELIYEEHHDHEGDVVKTGHLEYIAISAHGHPHKLYRFCPHNSHPGYYTPKGESVVRALLHTPLDPKKMHITSKFGKRKHPILGFTRAHKGVDFGSPCGTVVMAAGAGVVEKAGYNGDFGKYVKIRHTGGYETEYAHLSKISPGIKAGASVSQGHVIGHVGATGLARGCHLHYGVLLHKVHINPLTIKQMPTVQLTGKDLEKFHKLKHEVDTQLAGLKVNKHFAKSEPFKQTIIG